MRDRTIFAGAAHARQQTPDLRTIEIEGAPWFVASDACRILGLPYGGGKGSSGQHLRRLGADEKRLITRTGGIGVTLFDGSRAGSLTLVTESGLYKLIMRSDKATARPFQDWVTKVVLPSIRKTGDEKHPLSIKNRVVAPGQLSQTLGESNVPHARDTHTHTRAPLRLLLGEYSFW